MKLLLAATQPVAKKKGPSKTVVGANEEIKRGEFAKPLLPMRLTKTALSVLDKDDKRSDCGSIVSSVASNRSCGGMIKRHCKPCGLKLISNMSKHKKDVHGGFEVESVKCAGAQCPTCIGKYFETFYFYNLDP